MYQTIDYSRNAFKSLLDDAILSLVVVIPVYSSEYGIADSLLAKYLTGTMVYGCVMLRESIFPTFFY